MRYFLVEKPRFEAPGLVGRATQGYVAVDPLAKEPKKKLVWLKDAWRTFYDLVDPEGDVLQLLKSESVPNVPTFVCHGDLPDQATVTPDIWDSNFKAAQAAKNAAACTPTACLDDTARVPASASPAPSAEAVTQAPAASTSGTKRPRVDDDDQEKMPPPPGVGGSKTDDSEEKCPLRRHVHYRIVVEEVGLPLEEFEDGHHLVSVICDCVEGTTSVCSSSCAILTILCL